VSQVRLPEKSSIHIWLAKTGLEQATVMRHRKGRGFRRFRRVTVDRGHSLEPRPRATWARGGGPLLRGVKPPTVSKTRDNQKTDAAYPIFASTPLSSLRADDDGRTRPRYAGLGSESIALKASGRKPLK
jgi:hypothetical protein